MVDLLRWDKNNRLSFLFLIEAQLELGISTNVTLYSFTATSEIESIAVATDWFAARLL